MNTLKSYILAISLIVGIGCSGCKSSPETIATKAAGTQVLIVDGVMKGWADWVKQGHATQEEVDAVRDAHMTYFIAAQAEKKALLTYVAAKSDTNSPAFTQDFNAFNATIQAVGAAEADLIALVTRLKK